MKAEFDSIERVLAAHTGTVQLLLSLWWDEEVIVEVDGPQTRAEGRLRRAATLKLKHSGRVVAQAISYIDLERNAPAVLADIEAGTRGIGQIAITVCTLGIFSWVWPLIDVILIAVGTYKDGQGRLVLIWET